MFDLARFRRLAAATWSENRRAWGWFFLVGIIVHVLLVLGWGFTEDGWRGFDFEGQSLIWLVGLFVVAPVFAARYFQAMARRESALVLLMRPASTFEKWLLAAILILLLYPVAYLLAFQVAGLPSFLYGKAMASAELADTLARIQPSRHAEIEEEFANQWRYFVPWRMEHIDWAPVLATIASLQGFALLGSLYFRSVPFIKTVVVGFILLLYLVLATAVLGGDPDLFFGYWSGETRLAPWQSIALPAAWIGVPVLLWLGGLVALREKEVA